MKRQKSRNDNYEYKKLMGKDSDESGEETELFVRKSRAFKEIPTIEKIVQEGDTLQALSIRYHCPIAELKRLNNIHKENEIFARNTIKVPAHPFTEALAGVHDSGNNSPNGKIVQVDKIDDKILQNHLEDTFSNKPSTSNEIDFNTVIFNSNLVSSNKECDKGENIRNDVVEEEIRLLPIVPNKIQAQNKWSCSDSDISWIFLIICVILIFALPLIYVFYIAEHVEEFHHKHLGHNNVSLTN